MIWFIIWCQGLCKPSAMELVPIAEAPPRLARSACKDKKKNRIIICFSLKKCIIPTNEYTSPPFHGKKLTAPPAPWAA